ncbi:cytochrome P450 [Myxococcota bacterium]|nr:cytochrome P450 [Myxococcota bacterium]
MTSSDSLTARAGVSARPPDPAGLSDAAKIFGVILDPQQRGDLYPYLRRLREVEPLHRTEALHGRPAWMVTRFADALELLSNKALVSDERNAEIFDTGPSGALFYAMVKRLLLYINPVEHDRIRKLLARHFTPRAVSRYRPLMQNAVDDLLAKVEGREEIDIVADLAYSLPTAVICEILGVPAEDLPVFHRWLNDFARRGDVSGITPEVERLGEESVLGFTDYFERLISERRKRPQNDLMTILVEARDEQGGLDEDALVALCILMIQAGHETTADMIALGVLALLRHPDQLVLLRSKPELLRNAIEEMLRYDGSNQLVQRVSHEDFELAGVSIRAGEVCSILTGAAGRDPARFAEPDRLDIERREIQHFGFGHGSHICLGSALARFELEAMLGSLIARFPGLELAEEEIHYRDSLVLRGLKRLAVRL